MHRGYQLSLLRTGQGKGYLFGEGVLDKYLQQHETTPIPRLKERALAIQRWLDAIDRTTASETSLEPQFVAQIFCEVLGYVLYPASERATLYSKPKSNLTGIIQVPDATLGEFTDLDTRFVVAVELKAPAVDLDTPQPSHNNKTPVEQGFFYGKNILGIRWVIVSDMRVIRLYSIEVEDEYEEITLRYCVDVDGNPTPAFRRLFFLLHQDYLVAGRRESQVSLLYAKSAERQIQVRESFYELYYQIRSDLYNAICTASSSLAPSPERPQLIEATQRLLDRLLFIYYCEDHPQQLIEKGTIKSIVEAVRRLPGPSNVRIYQYLKHLFREIDVGSPPSSGLRIAAYNGELFKDHPIVDRIELPDSLDSRRYTVISPDGERLVSGVWGLHVYDFWSELNEYLLGHIFEESLTDLGDLGLGRESLFAEKVRERKSGGIFFTSSILADFLCDAAVQSTLDEIAPLAGDHENALSEAIARRIEHLRSLRAVDFACGSGAFLSSLYRGLFQEFWRLQSSLAAMKAKTKKEEIDLFSAAAVVDEARSLPNCLFGVDVLPQAVEIAKLAIWLRSARKEEKVLDLSRNIVTANSLDLPFAFDRLGGEPGSFDLVVGNPPWGSDIEPAIRSRAMKFFGKSDDGAWDSWELFLLLAIRALREGGRLALVLPDSFLYPQKARIRKLLFEQTNVEKVHNLGPDWFGSDVRMGTVVIQARRGPVDVSNRIKCLILSGRLRSHAIRGELPLTQIEAQRSRWVPTSRVTSSATRDLEVFRGVEDDEIIGKIGGHSVPLSGRHSGLCKRARGEEINKAGLLWICPGCLTPTTPGKKLKGGGFEEKQCEKCKAELSSRAVDTELLVSDRKPTGRSVTFIDGDDISRRYVRVRPTKWLRLGLSGWSYKNAQIYASPKLLIRQAGVGVCATLDETNSRCPQSVYIYRLREEQAVNGYRHEFVLAAILSRTMAYYVFKRFSEVDPAKAHAKLTHDRLEALPIPMVDFDDGAQRSAHDKVVDNVRALITGRAELGGAEDREIEQILRTFWGITGPEGAYINGEFYDLPESQATRDLFPNGRPRPTPATHILS